MLTHQNVGAIRKSKLLSFMSSSNLNQIYFTDEMYVALCEKLISKKISSVSLILTISI